MYNGEVGSAQSSDVQYLQYIETRVLTAVPDSRGASTWFGSVRTRVRWLAENLDAAAETFYSFACVGRWS